MIGRLTVEEYPVGINVSNNNLRENATAATTAATTTAATTAATTATAREVVLIQARIETG